MPILLVNQEDPSMQLLVPQSVRSLINVADNITVSSLNTTEPEQSKTSWPSVQGIMSSSDRNEGIAFTGNEDAQAVSAMLATLSDHVNVARAFCDHRFLRRTDPGEFIVAVTEYPAFTHSKAVASRSVLSADNLH
jgi:hypothetical protein